MAAEHPLHGGGRTQVHRRGDVVHRQSGPWTPTVHAFLRHLDAAGFAAAPRIVGTGFDEQGRETLTFIEGQFTQPGPWSDEGAAAVGRMLGDLHAAAATFRPPADPVYRPWFGRQLGDEPRLVSHCDAAPWNIVARDGLPVALIDWETVGPVDPLVELAQVAWLNAKLHDNVVADIERLPPLTDRARQLRALLDGYALAARKRSTFVERMIGFAIADAANEADELDARPDSIGPVWGLAWRTRAAAFMERHRRVLDKAIAR